MDYDRQYYQNIAANSLLLPILYGQSKWIRKTMPQVGPAKHDISGAVLVRGSTPIRLICIGESTMAGVGVTTLKQGLPGLVSTDLSKAYGQTVQWVTHAYVGYSLKQVNDNLRLPVCDSTTTIALIATGGNDSFYLTRPSSWLVEVQRIVDSLQAAAPNIKICFASFPPAESFPGFGTTMRRVLGRQTQLLRQSLIEYIADLPDITFVTAPVDFEAYVGRSAQASAISDLFCDGFHPSSITYDIWAQDIAHHIIHHL